MLTEREFDTGTVVINYAESEGPRPPLVMLHGITLWWKYFLPVLPQLSARWHTYALDLRGHGKSGHVPGGYRLETYAEDVVALLQARVSEPAVLAGHSLGGRVALQVAVHHPELIRALILEDAGPYEPPGGPQRANNQYVIFRDLAASDLPLGAIADRIAEFFPDRDTPGLRMRAQTIRALDPDVLTMAFDGRTAEHYDADALLRAIFCPLLLLRADPAQSRAVTDEAEAALRAAIKDVSVVHFPGVGHGIQAGAPNRYARVVSDFLESLE